jgi:hypothetical protein
MTPHSQDSKNVALIEFDTDAFAEKAKEFGQAADQLPFALMTLLNDAVFHTRQVLVQSTWPRHVEARNPQFISAALRVEKATKQNLEVKIYDQIGRANLYAHARGGMSRPRKASKFAIPGPTIQRSTRGVAARDRPAAIIERTPKRALRVTSRGIFVAEGGRLHLKYSFKQQVAIAKDVPFYEDFAYSMKQELRTGFAEKFRKALASRRGPKLMNIVREVIKSF